MKKLALVAGLVALLISCSAADESLKEPGKAISIQAPKYVSGTKFVLEKTNFGTEIGKLILEVRGTNETGIYNISNGNKRWWFGRRIEFPLKLGETWTYSYTARRGGWCDDNKNRMKAKVGRALEKASLNGLELDIVRITHKGTWSTHCSGSDLEGKIFREYLYSPKLGMFVETSNEIWSANDRLQVNTGLRLISYSIPGQKQK